VAIPDPIDWIAGLKTAPKTAPAGSSIRICRLEFSEFQVRSKPEQRRTIAEQVCQPVFQICFRARFSSSLNVKNSFWTAFTEPRAWLVCADRSRHAVAF